MGWDGLVGTERHCASPPFADTEVVTAPSVAVKQHGDGGGPQTVVDEALVRTPNFTLTVGIHLRKRRSAQLAAATYSHGDIPLRADCMTGLSLVSV